ncbi:MAG: exosortase-associated EpsI family protein [Phycisphaerae bacterium]|nr:exosortase-associated EpsI family protein [Phycisphaerales bacterium]
MGNNNRARAHGLFGIPFLLACAMLLGAHFLVGKQFAHPGEKKMLELRKPFGQMNKDDLGNYRFKTNLNISPEVEDALGAKDYLSWLFVDSSVKDTQDPLRYIRLFVTYYSGGRDLVPHTPDECFLGAGYQAIEKENMTMPLPSLGIDMPIRVLTFQKSDVYGRDKPTVLYNFHCNGEFTETRNGVRSRINSPLNEYAYFCKIEVSFGGSSRDIGSPGRAESIQAAQKFLDAVLPRLVNDHLPDWEAATSESKTAADK